MTKTPIRTPNEFLADWLERRDVTQKALAEAAAVHESLISAIARGDKKIRHYAAMRIEVGTRALAEAAGHTDWLTADELCEGTYHRDAKGRLLGHLVAA